MESDWYELKGFNSEMQHHLVDKIGINMDKNRQKRGLFNFLAHPGVIWRNGAWIRTISNVIWFKYTMSLVCLDFFKLLTLVPCEPFTESFKLELGLIPICSFLANPTQHDQTNQCIVCTLLCTLLWHDPMKVLRYLRTTFVLSCSNQITFIIGCDCETFLTHAELEIEEL